MRSVLPVLLLLAAPAPAAAADPATLRARAALALAFADPGPPAGYPELYARAVRDQRPLVVWVGQPARPVPGCVGAACRAFPAAGPEGVVVGVPVGGGLRRVDLPGRPTDADLLAAVRGIGP